MYFTTFSLTKLYLMFLCFILVWYEFTNFTVFSHKQWSWRINIYVQVYKELSLAYQHYVSEITRFKILAISFCNFAPQCHKLFQNGYSLLLINYWSYSSISPQPKHLYGVTIIIFCRQLEPEEPWLNQSITTYNFCTIYLCLFPKSLTISLGFFFLPKLVSFIL